MSTWRRKVVIQSSHLVKGSGDATAYNLSFAKSLVDYDDKNLTKAMPYVFGSDVNLSGTIVLQVFSDYGSSLAIAKALEDDGSVDPP